MSKITIIKRTTGIVVDVSGHPAMLKHFRELCGSLNQIDKNWNYREKRFEHELKYRWYRYEKEFNRLLLPWFVEKDVRQLLKEKQIPHNWVDSAPVDGITSNIEMAETFKYRKGQEDFVNYITSRDSHTRILPATMGAGKTVSSLAGISQLKENALCIIPPSLKDEWIDTIGWATSLTGEDYIFISGSESLKAYQQLIINEPNPIAITLIGINTFQNFLNNYIEDDYPLTPLEFFDKSGFGIKIVDEAHKNQHFHMTTNLYSNIRQNIYLTATLMKEREFEADIENKMYPVQWRCPVPEPTNHVLLRSYHYRFNPKIPPHVGPKGYSHAKFEKAILKKKRSLNPYLEMLESIVKRDWGNGRQETDKMLAFFALTDMADAFFKLMKKAYPKLNVVRYGAGDSKSMLKTADIIISTVKKAGTGTDVPQLTYVLQTVPISAKGENFQNVGRLRNLDDKDTVFAYMCCNNVPKQLEYHKKRQRELTPLTHKKEKINYPKLILYT